MKINVIFENNKENKLEIEISEIAEIESIKKSICKQSKFDEELFKSYFDLIYDEFILNVNKPLKFYNIKSEDKIWIGKIENYLQNDEIILEVFIIGLIPEWMFLVVNMHATMADVIDTIEKVIPNFNNLYAWDKDGNYIFMNKIISEIDKVEGYHKVWIKSLNEQNFLTFFKCCEIHDRTMLDTFSANYQDDFLIFENCFFMEQSMINAIKDLLNFDSSRYTNQSELSQLDELVSSINISFQNIKFLFCTRMADRIFYTCKMFWKNLIKEVKKLSKEDYLSDFLDVFNIFDKFDDFFKISLLVSILKYLKTRENIGGVKSIGNIMGDSIQFLINPATNWNKLVKCFLVEFLFDSVDNAINIVKDLNKEEKSIIVKSADGFFHNITFLAKPRIIRNIKESISKYFRLDENYFFVFKNFGDRLPDEDELLDSLNSYQIEIILNISDNKSLKALGRGGFGRVDLYEIGSSAQSIALKRPTGLMNKILSPEIFIYNILSKYAGIVRIYGYYFYEMSICPAMEYLPGGTLTSTINKVKRFSDHQIAKIALQILKQLKCFHDEEIIHGDIKCDNIVFDNDNCAKLIDFDQAKLIKGYSKEKLLETIKLRKPGTSVYMAPELLNTESYSYKCDIWSFGVMVMEMILGKSPFITIPLVLKIKDSRKIEFIPPYPLSPELSDFINHCLESDPDKRASVDELIESKFMKKYLLHLS